MVKKECRHCARACYSFSREGIWICPHCGRDITHQPPARSDRATEWVLPIAVESPDELPLN
ncbi:MAG TPA: hypothetical protein VFK80_10675 [Limnochordia bacterium]|nr:hypothetical protein [Limnochordia bacterium]